MTGVVSVCSHLDGERCSGLCFRFNRPLFGMVSGVNKTFFENGEFVLRNSFDILYAVESLVGPGVL